MRDGSPVLFAGYAVLLFAVAPPQRRPALLCSAAGVGFSPKRGLPFRNVPSRQGPTGLRLPNPVGYRITRFSAACSNHKVSEVLGASRLRASPAPPLLIPDSWRKLEAPAVVQRVLYVCPQPQRYSRSRRLPPFHPRTSLTAGATSKGCSTSASPPSRPAMRRSTPPTSAGSDSR